MKASVALLLLVLSAGCEASVRKRWTPDWNLNSKRNWREERLPCGGGVASLPRYPENSLFLGADLMLGSLDLPVEGELILGDKARLMFDDAAEGGCKDAEWIRRGSDQWWDPDAWSDPVFDDPVSSPVPHLHRVPCLRDTALFPPANDSFFTVHLSPPAISVTSLFVGNATFTTSEFAAYARTPEGRLRFQGFSSITDNAPLYLENPGECRDVTGCMCGSEQAASVICRIMSAKCGAPRCDNPIDMTGFCCPVCGAEVTIDHGGTLPLESLRTLLQHHLQTPAMRDIRGHAAKMSDQSYHVYFTAANPNGDYKAASESFKTKFNKVLNAADSHEVLVSYAGEMKPRVSSRVAPHHVAVTLVTLTLCLVFGAAVYYFRKRRISTSSLSFMFRRLDDNRRVSVVSDVIGGRRPSNASSVFAYSRESGLRFFNPIFNQSMASLERAGVSSVINEEAQPPSEEAEGQHENPMYTAFQKMPPDEQEASERAIQEREKILEAAGQLVASSLRRKSLASENNLKSIKEEDTKEETCSDGDVKEAQDKDDTDTQQKDGNTDSLIEEKTVSNQEQFISEDKEDGNPTTNTYKPELNDEVDPEGETDREPIVREDTTQTIIDIGEGAPGHVEKQDSSSSSSDDEDADSVLMNLEGFTPLVDLKFKK